MKLLVTGTHWYVIYCHAWWLQFVKNLRRRQLCPLWRVVWLFHTSDYGCSKHLVNHNQTSNQTLSNFKTHPI